MPPARPRRRFVALLRAINVGGHTVTMARLRGLFSDLGFNDVETVVASGNVLFGASVRGKDDDLAAQLEATIEPVLARALGYEVTTFLRRQEELQAVIDFDPMPLLAPAQGDHVLSVAFLKQPPRTEAAEALRALRNDVDDFLVRGREVYWLRRTRQAPSLVMGPRFERALQLSATVRNITTVRKLAGKA